MNHYNDDQHKEVANSIKKIKHINWIVSYDNTPEIENIYRWVPKDLTRKYSFNHSAYKAREGKEILFCSKNLQVPRYVLSV